MGVNQKYILNHLDHYLIGDVEVFKTKQAEFWNIKTSIYLLEANGGPRINPSCQNCISCHFIIQNEAMN